MFVAIVVLIVFAVVITFVVVVVVVFCQTNYQYPGSNSLLFSRPNSAFQRNLSMDDGQF